MLIRLILALVVTCILTLNSKCASAAYISRSGGYNLVIAVDDSTPLPSNTDVPKFLNNVQHIFTQFANHLWLSTRKKFHVNSVDLLVPNDWNVTDANIATIQTFETADFKISLRFESARSDNANPCNSIGTHVELPVDFFSDDDPPKYGDPVRAVLNLFARYRYGVWEEHGEIGSTRFPYFHFEPSHSPIWTWTGCSKDLQGQILARQGEDSSECNPFTAAGPSDNCRFIPEATNTVNCSLNFLPWAPRVSEFCDEESHNTAAPNRQNLFCGHRSVWGVIKESEDFYQTVGKPFEEQPEMTFRVVTNSQLPLLYILLDRGRTSASTETLDQIVQNLEAFVNGTFLPEDLITAIGTYPQNNFDRSHFYVKEEGEWSSIRDGSTKFASVIRQTMEHYDGPVVRDFGLAIGEVVEKVRVRNHPAGAIILVVKRGATQNGFEHSTYFGDVMASLQKHNLRLYAIEIQQNEKTPYVNLGRLTTLTFGGHSVITSTTDVSGELGPFLDGIRQKLMTPLPPAVNRTWTVFKGFVPLRNEITIPVLDDNVDLTICLTIKKYIPESEIEIRQVEGVPAVIERFRRDEWNEVADTSKRTVIIATIANPTKGSSFDVYIKNCTSVISDDCVAFLEASVETNDATIPSGNLDIQISTSAANNYLDFDRTRGISSRVAPLSIFAQIEMGGQRVLGLERVVATVIYENLRQWTIPLRDDGTGLPDVSGNDGIYSAVFTPPQNGVYKISVTVTHGHGAANEVEMKEQGQMSHRVEIVNLLGHLIPMDQSTLGCDETASDPRCFSAPISGSLTRSENMLGTILVDNSITFSPRPGRIFDFRVTTLPENKVQFGFTSPKVLGIDGAKVEYHYIYMGSSVDQFVEGTDNLQLILRADGFPPGQYVTTSAYDVENSTTIFFAVESQFNSLKAGPSNVVGITTTEDGVTPVPQPTTTTTTPVPITSTPTPGMTSTQSTATTRPPSVTTTSRPTQQTTQRPPLLTTVRGNGGNALTHFALWTITLVPILVAFK